MEKQISNQQSIASLPTQKNKPPIHSGLYLLPNLMTASSLFCGFLALKFIVQAQEAGAIMDSATSLQYFVWASYAILLGTVFDGLDGSVARLTRTQSSFGGQFDSLSDLMTFGLTPAVLAYQFALRDLGRLGLGIAFIFVICGAMRLARFNVQNTLGKGSGNFTGIPIPMGATPIALYVLAFDSMKNKMDGEENYEIWSWLGQWLDSPSLNSWILLSIVLLLAMGMVSSFEYISTKTLKLPKKKPFTWLMWLMVSTVLFLSTDFKATLAVLCIVYCLHGPVMWVFGKMKRNEEEEDLFDVGIEDDKQ